MQKILIIGYGIVGHNLADELESLQPDIFDKYKPVYNTKKEGKYHIAFICIDTPYVSPSNPCDITEIESALSENEADVYVIKSTILPGTTEYLAEKTGKQILFSPEYYGSTHFSNNYCYDFTILGGNESSCCCVIQTLQTVYDCRHRFMVTSAKTAELAKYMENTYLALKVSFSSQFWSVAQECGVNYEQLRELFILDPRVNPSNTFIFAEHPYWDSHCFNKDLPAIASTYNMPLVDSIISFNERMKALYKK